MWRRQLTYLRETKLWSKILQFGDMTYFCSSSRLASQKNFLVQPEKLEQATDSHENASHQKRSMTFKIMKFYFSRGSGSAPNPTGRAHNAPSELICWNSRLGRNTRGLDILVQMQFSTEKGQICTKGHFATHKLKKFSGDGALPDHFPYGEGADGAPTPGPHTLSTSILAPLALDLAPSKSCIRPCMTLDSPALFEQCADW